MVGYPFFFTSSRSYVPAARLRYVNLPRLGRGLWLHLQYNTRASKASYGSFGVGHSNCPEE